MANGDTDAGYEGLHPDFSPKLQQLQQILRDQYGLQTRIGEGYRSPQRQSQLYAQSRTARGPIVTGAPAGFSYHNYGAAVDLRPVGMNEDQAGRVVGQAIKDNPGLGLTWGGSFSNLYDPLHVQLGVPLTALRGGSSWATPTTGPSAAAWSLIGGAPAGLSPGLDGYDNPLYRYAQMSRLLTALGPQQSGPTPAQQALVHPQGINPGAVYGQPQQQFNPLTMMSALVPGLQAGGSLGPGEMGLTGEGGNPETFDTPWGPQVVGLGGPELVQGPGTVWPMPQVPPMAMTPRPDRPGLAAKVVEHAVTDIPAFMHGGLHDVINRYYPGAVPEPPGILANPDVSAAMGMTVPLGGMAKVMAPSLHPSTIHYAPGDMGPPAVGMKPWTPPEDWSKVAGRNPNIFEPEGQAPPGKKWATGLVMVEPDGRVWLAKPKGGGVGGSTQYTFPKGHAEVGLNDQANAIKEAYEETGLRGNVIAHLGDYEGDTTMTRYFLAHRAEGSPFHFGPESEATVLAHPEDLPKLLNKQRDRDVAADLMAHPQHPWNAQVAPGVDPSMVPGVPGPTTEAVKAAEDATGGYFPVDHWTQTGPQEGSNPGGEYTSTGGQKWYVKFPETEDHARNERLTSELYRLTGADVPHTMLVQKGDKVGIASHMLPEGSVIMNKVPLTTQQSKMFPDLQQHFASDAWLSNRDVIGGYATPKDNVMLTPDGRTVRIDPGGGLRYRGMGQPKTDFGPDVSEWDYMLNKGHVKEVYGNMTPEGKVASIDRVLGVPASDIHNAISKYGPKDPAEADKLFETLLNRQAHLSQIRDGIQAKGGGEWPALEEEIKALLAKKAKASGLPTGYGVAEHPFPGTFSVHGPQGQIIAQGSSPAQAIETAKSLAGGPLYAAPKSKGTWSVQSNEVGKFFHHLTSPSGENLGTVGEFTKPGAKGIYAVGPGLGSETDLGAFPTVAEAKAAVEAFKPEPPGAKPESVTYKQMGAGDYGAFTPSKKVAEITDLGLDWKAGGYENRYMVEPMGMGPPSFHAHLDEAKAHIEANHPNWEPPPAPAPGAALKAQLEPWLTKTKPSAGTDIAAAEKKGESPDNPLSYRETKDLYYHHSPTELDRAPYTPPPGEPSKEFGRAKKGQPGVPVIEDPLEIIPQSKYAIPQMLTRWMKPTEYAAARAASPFTVPTFRGITEPGREFPTPSGGQNYHAYYSTSDPGLASRYALHSLPPEMQHSLSAARIQHLLLDTRNYLHVDAEGKAWTEINRAAAGEAARRGKYGVVINNTHDEPTGGQIPGHPPVTSYLTFRPGMHTIRSAGARFDPAYFGKIGLKYGVAGALPAGVVAAYSHRPAPQENALGAQ